MGNIAKKKRASHVRPSFKPWSKGKIQLVAGSDIKIEIVEDRGPIGYQGRHIVLVRTLESHGVPPRTFEVGADLIKLSRSQTRAEQNGKK
jgi:hypothetical protein